MLGDEALVLPLRPIPRYFHPFRLHLQKRWQRCRVIVPILITDPDGELKYLMAPMLIKNSIVGREHLQSLSVRPGGRQMQFIASLTERIERKLLFNYTDPAFSDGRYFLTSVAPSSRTRHPAFFGLGQTTIEAR